jgi:hypothetical protein
MIDLEQLAPLEILEERHSDHMSTMLVADADEELYVKTVELCQN